MQLNDVSGLQVDQDMDHQRRWWRIQRVARYALGAFLAIGAVGALGHGPVAAAKAGAEPLQVEYQRLVRHSTSTQVSFLVTPGPDKQASFWLGNAVFDSAQVLGVIPEPERREVASDRIVFHFAATETGEPVTIRFDLQLTGYGPLAFRAGVPGGAELAWTAFVFP
ncbi:hypothetical protein D3C72_671070 [compost metagenome]